MACRPWHRQHSGARESWYESLWASPQAGKSDMLCDRQRQWQDIEPAEQLGVRVGGPRCAGCVMQAKKSDALEDRQRQWQAIESAARRSSVSAAGGGGGGRRW